MPCKWFARRETQIHAALQPNETDKGRQVLARAAIFANLYQDFDSPEAVLASLKTLYADDSATWPSKYHDIALLAAFFGDPEFALEVFSVEARLLTVCYGALWYPVMAEARSLPAFKTLVTDVNLVGYWRAYGWPDHCRPTGAEDLECS